MTNLTIIVAVARNGAIGRNGDLAFYISDDLRHFKSLTMGHPIIMGRRTFESLPKGALPGRRNIVVTRNTDFAAPNVETAPSLQAAIDLVSDVDQAFIIGGGSIYQQAMPLASRLEITHIEADAIDADTFFPAIDSANWQLIERMPTTIDPRSNIPYHFASYIRKN